MKIQRRYPIGAEIIPRKGVHFRVWTPDHQHVFLRLIQKTGQEKEYSMQNEKNGYFSLLNKEAQENSLYYFRIDKSEQLLPDPASRFQPEGPFGPSQVISPFFKWSDGNWRGLKIDNQIIYEMHIGTFTQNGTFPAAMQHLKELAKLGITALEIMPLNDFPGHFGWGYDGVNLYAPTHLYGTPNDVKQFIDAAHALGLGVLLDVVYNHFGPEGNFITQFSKDYLNKTFVTDWGDAINFDLQPVREFFLTNVQYWLEEFHFDGLRVDSTPQFFCSTSPHVLAELTKVKKKSNIKKKVIFIGENEKQDTHLLKDYSLGGCAFDALWNDDFHHSARVRLTGKREAYYTDYLGSPQEFLSSIKYGFLYQGQYYSWQKKERGTLDLNLPPSSMIIFLENHDQIANSGHGKRLHQLCDQGNYKAMTCLLLLSPNTPLLFQGQEFGSSRRFVYFADHAAHLNPLIDKGRKESLAQFPRLATSEARKVLPSPSDPLTFTQCKLDWRERDENSEFLSLHRDLIKLRKEDPVFNKMQKTKIDGAVLGTDSFLIRYFGKEDGDRLIIINFGPDHHFNPAPEPLLVPGIGLKWEILWSSESLNYGGEGTPPITIPHWKILGHSAIVLKTKKVKKLKSDATNY